VSRAGAARENAVVKRERADIICMNCGRHLAEVERHDGRLRLIKSERAATMRVIEGRPRCMRCGGRGFVEERMAV
jgi:DNA-directed RNA polymerase subunit RPC12/RpoP